MSARDDIQSAVQMMTMEMRNLSNSFNHAVRNMQQATSGAMANVGVMAGTAQGYAASAMGTFFPPGPRPQLGFSGMPTSNQYSGGMAGHIDSGKDAAWRNWLTSAGNNEYNKPSSWWRDTLALMGKEFVDVSQQDARRKASRNWGVRMGNLGHSAVSTALAFVPGFGLPLSLGYEFLVKPWAMEGSRRRNEYMDWLDQTGARNIGARWSNAAGGGWTDEEQKELAGKLQGLYKGSGFKKSQFDELMTSAEQHGYFKTYDRTNVDREVKKAKRLIDDAKYVMQSLHTTAEEAVKVLGDVNKMGATSAGRRGTHSYISQLNTASAYSGLSPMQIHEYSVGRSDFFRGLGYNKRDATEITMQQITDYYRKIEPGKPDNLQGHLDLSARLSAAGSGMDAVDKAFLARYHMVDGQLMIDEKYDERVRRGGTKIGETTTRVENLFSQIDDDALIVALNRPGFAQYMYGKDSGRAPASLELDRQRETLHAFMMQFNAENDPLNFTWEDYMSIGPTKRSSFEFGMAKNLGVSPGEMSSTIRGIFTDREESERRIEREAAGLPTSPGVVNMKSSTPGQHLKSGWRTIRKVGTSSVRGIKAFRGTGRSVAERYEDVLSMVPESISAEDTKKAVEYLNSPLMKINHPSGYDPYSKESIERAYKQLSMSDPEGAAAMIRYGINIGAVKDGEFKSGVVTASDSAVENVIQHVIGTEDGYQRLDSLKKKQFEGAAVRLLGAYGDGGESWIKEEEERFRKEMSYYFTDADKITDKMIKKMKSSVYLEDGVAMVKGLWSTETLRSLERNIEAREYGDLKTEYGEHSSLASPSSIQADMNTEILTHIQQQNALTSSLLKTAQALEVKVT